jgi:hypothetical protein
MSPSKPNPGVPKPPSQPPTPANRRFGLGIPDPDALSRALRTLGREMRQAAMNALQRGAPVRPLGNPQAGVEGFQAPTAMDNYRIPDDTSLDHACDLVAVAGMSLLRDIPLAQLATHPIAQRLAATLESMGAIGTLGVLPVAGPDGLFRLNASQVGTDRVGRLVLAPIPLGWGEASFHARRRYGDYVGTEAAWQALQVGRPPGSVPELTRQQTHGVAVPMSTGRDIASLVHQDWPIQLPELVACQLLWAGAARSSRFPVLPNEAGFIDYGGAFDTICAVNSCRAAARSTWFAKISQERARPHELWRDAIAGRLHPAIQQHAGWLLELVGEYLTMAYAEGSPVHSDNPSGHAFFAGWGFTILKAYFADGPIASLGITSLHAELTTFAWHMAAGRSWAGIHTIASLRAGLAWGEQAAVSHLATLATESTQKLSATTFTGFFGNMVTVPGN